MKKAFLLLIIAAASISAFGQGEVSGKSITTGPALWEFFAGGSGTPAYNARTDNCGIGGETSCPSGGPLVLKMQLRPGDTYTTINGVPASPGALPIAPISYTSYSPCVVANGFNTGGFDPDYSSHVIMVTDPCTRNLTTTFNMGETAAETDVFTPDSSMFYVLFNGGGPYFYYLNKVYARAHNCSGGDVWPNACLHASQIQGGTWDCALSGGVADNCTTFSSKAVNFSHNLLVPNVVYELDQSNLFLYKDEICRALPGGTVDSVCARTPPDTFERTVYLSFADPTYGVLPCDYQSTWNGSLGMAADGSVALSEAGAGSYQSIGPGGSSGGAFPCRVSTPTAQTITADTFILPVNNNSRWVLPATPGIIVTGSSPTWTVTFPFTPSGDTIPNPPTTPHIAVTGLSASSPCNGAWPVTGWSTPGGGPYTVTATVTFTGTLTAATCGAGAPANIGYADSAFQASPGTTVGNEPNWMSTCQVVGDVCTDGTSSWTNIGDLNNQGPGFDILRYSPPGGLVANGYSRVNTRLGKVYRGFNEGISYPASGTPDQGQGYTPPGNFAAQTCPGNSCGNMFMVEGLLCVQYGFAVTPPTNGICPTNIPFTEYFTIHDGGSVLDPLYAQLTGTGGGSAAPAQIYSPATTPVDSPANSNYQGGWVSGHTYALHDSVFDPLAVQNLYVCQNVATCSGTAFAPSGGSSSPGGWVGNSNIYPGNSGGPITSYNYVWTIGTAELEPCLMRGNNYQDGQCPSHEIHGYMSNWGGGNFNQHLYSLETLNGLSNPGTQLLPSIGGIPGDRHGSDRNANITDTNMVASAQTDVPTMTLPQIAALNPGNAGGYGEFVGLFTAPAVGGLAPGATTPCTAPSGLGAGTNCYYRFFHNDNDGILADFAGQNNISGISQDGEWALTPTSMMGTRGSRSAALWIPNHAYPVGTYLLPSSTNNSNGFDWLVTSGTSPFKSGTTEPVWNNFTRTVTDGNVTWTRMFASCNNYLSHNLYSSAASRYSIGPGNSLNIGDLVFPLNANLNLFAATTAGTTNSSVPTWNATCPNFGNACSYGTAVLTNIGNNDCRGDIMLVDLLSAH